MLLVEDNPNDQAMARIANQKLDRPYRLDVVGRSRPWSTSSSCAARTPGRTCPIAHGRPGDAPHGRHGLAAAYPRPHAAPPHPGGDVHDVDGLRDVRRCYAQGCNSYVIKPMTISGLRVGFDASMRIGSGVCVCRRRDGAAGGGGLPAGWGEPGPIGNYILNYVFVLGDGPLTWGC